MHFPAMALVIVEGQVLTRPVVPDDKCAGRPTHPAGEGVLHLMSEQKFQQWRAFRLGHTVEAHCVAGIDIKGLFSGFRMCADNGVNCRKGFAFALLTDVGANLVCASH